MQTLDQSAQEVKGKSATKGESKRPCARLSDAYQKEDLKISVKRAFESQTSYNHGTSELFALMWLSSSAKNPTKTLNADRKSELSSKKPVQDLKEDFVS